MDPVALSAAARQAGLADSNLLPDNSEIDEALREYQGLYQKEEQPAHLRRLREVAVKVMREFESFRPALVGSVLSGTAGRYSDVNLQLFADDSKAITMFLLNRHYRFEEGSRRVRRGERMDDVPQISLEVEDVTVTLTVLDRDDERSAGRAPQHVRGLLHLDHEGALAGIDAVSPDVGRTQPRHRDQAD